MMIMPLVVIDLHQKVAKNPDYTITMDDIRAWESKHGLILVGTLVVMRTDWSNPFSKSSRSRVTDPTLRTFKFSSSARKALEQATSTNEAA